MNKYTREIKVRNQEEQIKEQIKEPLLDLSILKKRS